MLKLMKHVGQNTYGAPSVLIVKESPIPQLKPNEVLLKIMATSINRADTLQRQGKYQPPPGSTDIIGLEAAGYVELDGVKRRVITLLPGGGYAQYVNVNRDHLIPISENIPWSVAGGIAEVYLTAYLQLNLAQLKQGDSCLIYAAASGVGIATMQLCHLKGITPIAVCSSNKVQSVKKYTPHVIDRSIPVADQLAYIKQVDQQGVNAVFDPVGKDNAGLSVDSLKTDGRWILYGLMSGGIVENFNLAKLLAKRVQLISTTLRSRSDEFKSDLIKNFINDHLEHVNNGQLNPEIHSVTKVNWQTEDGSSWAKLHELMESNVNTGKLNVVYEEDE